MADDDDIIEVHNKDDSFGTEFKNSVSNAIDGIKQIGSDFVKSSERYHEETGFYIGEDVSQLSPEECTQRLEEAQEKKEEKELKEKQDKEDEERERNGGLTDAEAKEATAQRLEQLQKEYIVSGARITCTGCSAGDEPMDISYVVVPISHGVKIHGLPQLNIKDCTVENIKKFGCCHSKENPKVVEAAKEVLKEAEENRDKGLTDRFMDWMTGASDKVETNVKDGLAECCAAECIFENSGEWTDGKEDVLIEDNEALLGKCTLQCKYGGTIKLYTNGLENAAE